MLDICLVDLLEILRRRIGNRPVIINSGYRCPDYNTKAGGVPASYHLYGMAADIRVPGMTPAEVIKYALDVGFLGLGLYAAFCHLDIRHTLYQWEG